MITTTIDAQLAQLNRRYERLSARQRRIVDAAVPPRDQIGETYVACLTHAISVVERGFLPT